MEFFDSGTAKYAIGLPSEDEKKKLESEGYTFMQKGRKAYEPFEEYELYMK